MSKRTTSKPTALFTSFDFFAGKGGVGKTTCAVAFANETVARSRSSRGALLISTDPAHSLGDVLGVRLGERPRRVGRALDAVELDAPRAFGRWLRMHRRGLSEVLEHGTWLDRADIDALLDLTIPGVDELAGLLEISALASGPYARVIVDTAPTGHTLRLLSAPETVTAVAGVLDALQEEHRIIRQQLAGVVRPDAADQLIVLLARQAADTAALLRDRRRTHFHWVTLPEPLAIAETEDGVAAMKRAGLFIAEMIVNRVLPAGEPCTICDVRRKSERRALAIIRKRWGAVRVVPEQFSEDSRDVQRSRASRRAPRSQRSHGSGASEVLPEETAAVRGAQLLFVGGKGGVGKTTVSAALALRIAKAHPRQSVLLLSTDPAHSVGDVLDTPFGDDERRAKDGPSNLVVRELDAVRSLAARREALRSAFEELGGTARGAGRIDELLELAPPGVDELFGMLSILDARAAHRVIVIDTAPTGHTLRLLETPATAREWIQTLLRMFLKYREVVRPGAFAAELVEASRSIRELQQVLHDRALTRFLVVTRAAPVVRAETERLLCRLRTLKLATTAIVVNARTPESGCPLCGNAADAERREVDALRRFVTAERLRDCAIIETRLEEPPPRGAQALDRWAHTWRA